MSITAFIQADPSGRLTADSTITVEGTTYRIPERGYYGPDGDRRSSCAAPHRISAALKAAGYQPAYRDVVDFDENGLITIEVERA